MTTHANTAAAVGEILPPEHRSMKYAVRSAPPPGDDAIEFVMSDGSVDRMGDVIEQRGWDLANFANDKNPVALFNHKADQVIGGWRDVRVVKGRLLGRLMLAARGTSELVDTVRALVEQKILRAVSVGFRPTEKQPLTDDADEFWGPFRFLKQELLECSLVAVPANPNALAILKSLPPDVIAEIFRKPAHEDRPTIVRALIGKPAKHLAPSGVKMLTRAQRIEAAQESLNTMRDRLEALDGQETRDEAQEQEYLGLPQQIEQTGASLAAMEAAEKALGSKTGGQRLPSQQRITVPAMPRQVPTENVREYLYKAAATLLIAKAKGRPIDDVLRDRYSGEIDSAVIRAVTNPAATGTAAWAGVLAQTVIADFINQLPRSAIYPGLRSRGASFTFGRNGTISIPSRSATPKINGSFVAEGNAIPVRKAGLTAITLTPKKMAVISTFTKEMADHSTPSIESVIRQCMNEDTAEAIDQALIGTYGPADAIAPAGLLFGLSTQTAAASGTQFEKMVADINTLMTPIVAARGGQNLVMLMNPAQFNKMFWAVAPNGTFVFDSIANGQVRNLTVIASTTVPAGQVIMLDAAEFATATGDAPEFDVSDVATIHEEDTTPLPISATGTPNTVAAPIRSLWQTASFGIRMILPMNWAMRRTGMVTFIAAVGW